MFHSNLRIACAALALSSAALADVTSAVTPPFRGTPCARFAGWEVFTSAYNGPNFPDVPGSTATQATITQLLPGAFLTTTGNIYNPFSPTAFTLADLAPADVQEVVLQTAVQGNGLNVGSITLIYTDPQGVDVVVPPTTVTVLLQVPQTVEELYLRWDLRGVADDVRAYRIHWVSSGPSVAFDAALLDVLHDCPPGVPICPGDGTGAACPCGNSGAPGNGCANSIDANGARLAATGLASVVADSLVLRGSGMPNSNVLYFQGTLAVQGGMGAPFGDGLRCAGGSTVRLGTHLNVAGSSQHPAPGGTPISVAAGVPAGATRVYQAWYRNAASFCSADTFNLSNAYELTWLP